MKKFLLSLLGVLLALPALARDFTYTHEGQTLTYTVISEEDKTCKTKEGGLFDNGYEYEFVAGNSVAGELVIPSVAKDGDLEYSVVEIGDYSFRRCGDLTSVVIGNSVTYIGSYAFNGCAGLLSVDLGNSVRTIGYEAFSECGFPSILLPPSVTEVDSYAFYGENLVKMAYPNMLSDLLHGTLFSIGIPYDPAGVVIEDGFLYSSDKTSIYFAPSILDSGYEIPNSITSIGEYAFSWSLTATSIAIPASVTSIGTMAFGMCAVPSFEVSPENPVYASSDGVLFNKDLTTLIQFPCGKEGSYEIPGFVKTIGDCAFSFCAGLTSVTIPESVTAIGDGAFLICQGLTSVSIPDAVTSIGNMAFAICQHLNSVTIGNSVETIGDGAFLMCYDLTSVAIGNSVTKIGDAAFSSCNSLSSVVLPESLITIGIEAFYSCGIKSLVIPDSVVTIGENAFSDCSLTTITIPGSVESIGEGAFGGNYQLSSIYYSAKTPIECSYGIFDKYDDVTLFVPQEAVELCKTITPWRYFWDIQAYDFGAGIEEICAEFNDNEPYEVYTLGGMKVSDSTDNLAPGIYILRQGRAARKFTK